MSNFSVRNGSHFVFPAVNESIDFLMKEEPYYRWILENSDKLDEVMVEALVSNVKPFGESGQPFMKELTSCLSNSENTEHLADLAYQLLKKASVSKPIPYIKLLKIGYTGDVPNGGFGSPVEAVQAEVNKVKFKNRGLTSKPKGQIEINPNKFASYVLRRISMVQLDNGQVFAYSVKGVYTEINDRVLKSICREILHEAKPDIWNLKWETEYFAALKREIHIVDGMNPEKGFINLANGMFDLREMELVEHDPKFLSTIQVPIVYDTNAECPKFIEFLYDVFENDQERIKLVQELLGYCFINEVKIQKAFFFVGPGANGKSVLAEVIRNLVGVQNVSNVALNNLGSSFGMQNLPDKLVNIFTENEFDRKFSTQNFKIITSGDAVEVNIKYHAPINTVLCAKSIVLLNRMMVTGDLSNGFFRRILIVPFNKIYRELKAGQQKEEGISYMDKSLIDKLLQELPGILNFALEGLKRLIQNNFNLTESKACNQAFEEYKGRLNPVGEYIEEKVYPQEGQFTLRSEFRRDFLKWAEENGYDNAKSINSGNFLDMFKNSLEIQGVNFSEKKRNGYWYIEGVGIFL
jgi:phage/plasmid primase, P4 family, C-terminal domain